MDTAPAFASDSEAIDTARAALGYLAAADAAQLAGAEQADAISAATLAPGPRGLSPPLLGNEP